MTNSDRRTAIQTASLVAAAAAATPAIGQTKQHQQLKEKLLRSLMPSRKDIDNWLARKAYPFARYDSGMGYLHTDRDYVEGIDKAVCRYRYDKLDARKMHAYADQKCRINTYGDSFTSCEQVSDGETWQEVLANHLCEPVRNYGIGGYSVYQAYLRMKREEQRAPARFIIFNIFDDDHVRNILSWQRFKFGVNASSINPTVPHVRVDLKRKTISPQVNPCPTPEDIYKLTDFNWVWQQFKDDPVLNNRIERQLRRSKKLPVPRSDYEDQPLMHHGITATKRIVELVEAYAKQNRKRVLYVLSYGGYVLEWYIKSKVRFDQALVDFLQRRKLAHVDLLRAHAADFEQFKVTPRQYSKRFFVGHYNPLGNHFCAFAMKDAVVKMLRPQPAAYPGRG